MNGSEWHSSEENEIEYLKCEEQMRFFFFLVEKRHEDFQKRYSMSICGGFILIFGKTNRIM